jgi:hypothetical protein
VRRPGGRRGGGTSADAEAFFRKSRRCTCLLAEIQKIQGTIMVARFILAKRLADEFGDCGKP